MNRSAVKVECKNSNCRRTSVELVMRENETMVLRIRNRHDGKTHTSDFDFNEIEQKFKEMKNL